MASHLRSSDTIVQDRPLRRAFVGRGPAGRALALLGPLALWLLVAKTVLVFAAVAPLPHGSLGALETARWAWSIVTLRFVVPIVLARIATRLLANGRPWLTIPLSAVLVLLLMSVYALTHAQRAFLDIALDWTRRLAEQLWGWLSCVWLDAATVAAAAALLGLILMFSPERARPWVVRLSQLAVIALSLLVGIDFGYQLATGQAPSLRMLVTAARHADEMGPLVWSELTPLRAVALLGGIVLACWAVHVQRGMAHAPLARDRRSQRALAGLMVAALPLALPPLRPRLKQLDRHVEGTLLAYVRAPSRTLVHEAQEAARRELARQGPRWHARALAFVPTERTVRKNVVVFLMESVRAASTTMHAPELATTPFLASLAQQGYLVEDMNVVIPRTSASWIATLAGQYPLPDEVLSRWVAHHHDAPRLAGLPTALRAHGYATSFFIPSTVRFLSDGHVLSALGFDHVRTVFELQEPGDEWVTYFGIPDERMLAPILDWTEEQTKAQKPFFTTIMSNVGHHDYHTPSSWKKRPFPEAETDELASYYNCLRYLDVFFEQLLAGYRRLGVLEQTVFVVLGDHGQLIAERDAKQMFNTLYQESVHVPALIYVPGETGHRIRHPRQQIDVLPTVAELLGYRITGASLPGTSLLSEGDPARTLYFATTTDWSALGMRRGSRKYVYAFDRAPMQIFDLTSDPGELREVTDAPQPELRRVVGELLSWRARAELSL